jgi:ribosomal protein L2
MARHDWSDGYTVITNVTDTGTEVLCKYEDAAYLEAAFHQSIGDNVTLVSYDPERDAYVFSVEYADEF